MASRRATRARVATLYDIGARAAFVLMLVAVILMLVTGVDPRQGSPEPPALVEWLPALAGLRPEAFIWAAIGVTAILPAATVAVAALGFARSGNGRPALTACAVLIALAATVVVAGLTH